MFSSHTFFDENLHVISLFPSYSCNLKCPYCYIPSFGDEHVLELEIIDKVLSEARKALDLESLDIVGGEPLLLPIQYLSRILRYAEKFRVGISTNLTVRDSLKIELLKYVHIIQISMHLFRFSDYNSMMNYAIDIKELLENINKEPESVIINIVITREMFDPVTYGKFCLMIEEILQVLHDFSSNFEIMIPYPYGHALVNRFSLPTHTQISAICNLVSKLRDTICHDYKINLASNACDFFRPRPNMWGRLGIVLDPYGNILPMDEGSVNLVNKVPIKFDTWKDPLDRIWHESKVLNMFRPSKWLPPQCVSCPSRNLCSGGSRISAFSITGDLFRMDPFCPFSEDHKMVLKLYSG